MFLDDPTVNTNMGRNNSYEGHVTPLMWESEMDHRDMVKILLPRKDNDINSCYHASPAIVRA